MVLRNSFMQKYAGSQRSELRYHAEAEENEMVPDPAEYEEIHTLPLEYLFSL